MVDHFERRGKVVFQTNPLRHDLHRVFRASKRLLSYTLANKNQGLIWDLKQL